INEAISANQLLLNAEKVKPLTERIDGQGTVYFHEFLERYEEILKTRGLKDNTLINYKSKLSLIRKGIIDTPIENISTKVIADFIQSYIITDKLSAAKQLRKSLSDIFKEAMYAGILENNPVSQTKPLKIKIQRSRLSLNDFNTILNLINDDNHWLSQAMKLALVTGQRVSDIAKIKWTDIHDGKLWIVQQKTGVKIAIPLKIEILDIKLSTIIKLMKNDSEFLISHKGKCVSFAKISKTFTRFRNKTNLTWEGTPPSFHEIRSLSARLYKESLGGDFTQKLLGHKSPEMTAKYQDERNNGWVELQTIVDE
ncbi:MAG TPA: tyrosine-type recombinase/integrase, partial [Arsenophonus nasoniae]|uniref:tyrosine-type recombinase/integrase n=1 Tax=Arsenophonus nasoniae TaxID=638 RepID=UPI0038795215